jgi:hypothetical protein
MQAAASLRPGCCAVAAALAVALLSASGLVGSDAHAQAPGTPASAVAAVQARREALAKMPTAPEGFEWAIFHNAAFLKPAGWKQREKIGQIAGVPTYAWAASPDDFSDAKPFTTGATVQIIDAPDRVLSVEARKMAMAYLKPFFDGRRPQDLLRFEQRRQGDFEYTLFNYRDALPGAKAVVVHKLLLANNRQDTVHIFTFESPEARWDADWKAFGATFIGRASVLAGLPVE